MAFTLRMHAVVLKLQVGGIKGKISNATWQGRVFPCRPAMPLAEIGEVTACTGEDENTPQAYNPQCTHMHSIRQSRYTMEVKQASKQPVGGTRQRHGSEWPGQSGQR